MRLFVSLLPVLYRCVAMFARFFRMILRLVVVSGLMMCCRCVMILCGFMMSFRGVGMVFRG
jgi:hypothetical protein